jgi:hypothetical protein
MTSEIAFVERGESQRGRLRQYHLRQGPMLKRFDEFYRYIAAPVWNRAGVTTVGVFDVMIGTCQPTKCVLLPFKSCQEQRNHRGHSTLCRPQTVGAKKDFGNKTSDALRDDHGRSLIRNCFKGRTRFLCIFL